MIYFYCVYEDALTWAVIQKLLVQYPEHFQIQGNIPCGGFGRIRKKIKAYNNAAKNNYFFIITDLDDDECAPTLLKEWLPEGPNQKMLFRVAVREIEAWLLADRENFAKFIGVSKDLITMKPDDISDPKNEIISLVRRKSRRSLRNDIVPVNQHDQHGFGYNAQLGDFVNNHWDITNASKYSPSLEKAVKALQKLTEETAKQGDDHVGTGSF